MSRLFAGAYLATDFGGMTVEHVRAGPDGRRYARLRFVGRDQPYDVEVDDDNAMVDEPAFLDALGRDWERVGPVGIARPAVPELEISHKLTFEVVGLQHTGGRIKLILRFEGEHPALDRWGFYVLDPASKIGP